MFLGNLRRDEKGATAIEYGLLAALVAIGLITALTNVKNSLNNTFNKVSNAVKVA